MTVAIEELCVPAEIRTELNRLTATYEIIKVSDKGQNSHLFIAHNKIIDRKVAIKFYFWGDGDRGHIEPKSLEAVKSDSIIEILEASLVGNEWACFITPFCEQGDLDRYLQTKSFGLREALRFVIALLEGVSVLHQQEFVHRDLKAENILVSDSGPPLIADFGSVRVIPVGADTVTASGHSVLYRPPESFVSCRYDRRGDVYQCGVILYQVLGGNLPYSPLAYLSGREQKKLVALTDDYERSKYVDRVIQRRSRKGSLLDLRSLPFFVPPLVRTIIRKATKPDPACRYQSASEFMNALNKVMGRIPDWRFVDREPLAFTSSRCFRIRPGTRHEHFIVEQNGGSGWRKVRGICEAPISVQLKNIADL